MYPERDYGAKRNCHIAAARKQVSETLLKQGYLGEYPLFQKDNHQILAMEEHPFTLLESKDFHFRIQLMESYTPKTTRGLNAGFFEKKGNHRRILDA